MTLAGGSLSAGADHAPPFEDETPINSQWAIEAIGIKKAFGGTDALQGVEFRLRTGEVHGLVGENGSGKSTLIKVLAGYHSADAGQAWISGNPVNLSLKAERQELAVVHQDLGLAPDLTVVENFGIATSWNRSRGGRISWKTERSRCRAACAALGLTLRPDKLVRDLEPAEQAMLAIIRAIDKLNRKRQAAVLILDEPTAYLSAHEANRVILLMRDIARAGGSVIFISHRLGEVVQASDRVSVMQDGHLVATLDRASVNSAGLVRLMLGRDIGDFYPSRVNGASEGQGRALLPVRAPLLQVQGVSGDVVDRLSFDLRQGEILGVTGLVAMGEEELPQLLTGSKPLDGGVVLVEGRPLIPLTVKSAWSAGIVFVPSERRRYGIWLSGTAQENITLPTVWTYFRRARLDRRRERKDVRNAMTDFRVHPPEPGRLLETFSGGNQQKCLLAKWLRFEPKALVLSEPTQGVDAGAKKEIWEIIQRVANTGTGVMVCSAEAEQLAAMCDRVLVLRHGRQVALLEGDEITEHSIIEMCNRDV